MIRKLLVANRGEIAVRVIRAARELGIQTVGVFSEADRDALFVRYADQSVCIGPPPLSDSYLFYQNILAAAQSTGADAIHPGYGFLAENASFAEACRALDLTFIGPAPQAIRKMGDKATAKRLMKEAGVPTVPGSEGVLGSLAEARTLAAEIGYPVVIKATAGGGGRGMRIVGDGGELENAFHAAVNEAQQAFGDSGVYLEKFIQDPKHIEIQVLGDKHGQVVHLFERDCSIQRRYQKLLEEAPSPVLTEATRAAMGEIAVTAARSVRYDSAGTIEFIYDGRSRQFFFIEMNTRIQVEHPVTEMITGVDLLQWQIRVAAGERLPLRQEEIVRRGHAIECRINAEDPQKGFLPQTGTLSQYIVPGGPGVRVDSGVYPGYAIPPFYDSLLAKLVVWGETRKDAVLRLQRALDEFIIEGVATTIPFHQRIVRHPEFHRGAYTTDFIRRITAEEVANAC
ncbi:MAG: acetyl-CoA carboxylase biotin carboxylase subunit [Candidatus Aminicenantes bacterium]|nr:acetyl-CoA carboxylase biotin carboxylase subunit [Candidatus Aminicenantes bacterium]